MSEHIPARLRRAVIKRAKGRCEYCRLAQKGQEATFHIDHIVPRREGGRTILRNLAGRVFLVRFARNGAAGRLIRKRDGRRVCFIQGLRTGRIISVGTA
jgi:hypothetical protein